MAAFENGNDSVILMALSKHGGSSPGMFINKLSVSLNPDMTLSLSLAVLTTSTSLKCLHIEMTSVS